MVRYSPLGRDSQEDICYKTSGYKIKNYLTSSDIDLLREKHFPQEKKGLVNLISSFFKNN